MTILNDIKLRAFQLSMYPAERRLARLKASQKAEFARLSQVHAVDYEAWRKLNVDAFTTPLWREFVSGLEPIVTPAPPFDFLRNPVLQKTMFVFGRNKWLETELAFLEERYRVERLRDLVIEDYAGDPPLSNNRYLTSHNSIHHLYHLARYSQRTNCDLEGIRSVVEWGGGYGNLAKIFKRQSKGQLTYVIVDLPLFSLLQWTYLATVLGEKEVHLISSPDAGIQEGKVNVLPLCFIDNINFKGEMFISTWALSESSAFSQDFVLSKKWFGAERILLAYQDSDSLLPDAGRVERIAKAEKMTVEDITFLPGNHYAFR